MQAGTPDVPDSANAARRPFRIGVWCTFASANESFSGALTLLPDQESGCSLHSLIQSLLTLQTPIEIALLIRPEAHRQLSAFYGNVNDRLALLIRPSVEKRFGLKAYLRYWVRVSQRLSRVRLLTSERISAARESFIAHVKGWTRQLLARTGRRSLLAVLAIPACLAVLVLWVAYAVFRVATALVDVIAFPVCSMDRLVRSLVSEFGPPQELEGPELRGWVRALGCDVWLMPSLRCDCPTGLPSVLVLEEVVNDIGSKARPRDSNSPVSEMEAARAADATLLVQPSNGESEASPDPRRPTDKVRVVTPWNRSATRLGQTALAKEWLDVLQEAARAYRENSVRQKDAPLPTEDVLIERDQPLEALLFLHVFYRGGVWETTKTLLRSLVEINRERRLLRLSFAVTEDQDNLHELDDLVSELTVERLHLRKIEHSQAARLLGSRDAVPANEGAREFVLAHAPATFRADAWLALADRFAAPLLPVRPYGVVVYDMIQKYVPALFPREFFVHVEKGMAPTARLAQAIVTTNEATQADVAEAYQIDAERLTLIPIPCEPHVRFGHLDAEPVVLPPRPFILNVANSGPHKGASILLRALARLKARLKEKTPLLVVCGVFTERFAPSFKGSLTDPHWRMVRRLVLELNLKEGADVLFLGYTDDRRLLDLFQRCSAVVNAAKYDNGTFSLIEGHYFGRPVLSSSYPAAEALYRRFEIPVRYFPIDDDAALAALLEQTVREAPLVDEALAQVRRHLADPKYSSLRYAEQVYDLLVRLATEGRAERVDRSHSQVHASRAA